MNQIEAIEPIVSAGASGVLGSAVLKAFKDKQSDVVGLANSRASNDLRKLDLTNKEEVEAFLVQLKPDCSYSAVAIRILCSGRPTHMLQRSQG